MYHSLPRYVHVALDLPKVLKLTTISIITGFVDRSPYLDSLASRPSYISTHVWKMHVGLLAFSIAPWTDENRKNTFQRLLDVLRRLICYKAVLIWGGSERQMRYFHSGYLGFLDIKYRRRAKIRVWREEACSHRCCFERSVERP